MSDKKGFRRVGNFVKKVARAAKDVDAFIIGADELGLLSKEDFVTKQKPQGSRRSKAPEYSSADQYENVTAEEATRINNSLWLKSMPQWNDDCRFEAFRPKKFLGEGAYGIIGAWELDQHHPDASAWQRKGITEFVVKQSWEYGSLEREAACYKAMHSNDPNVPHSQHFPQCYGGPHQDTVSGLPFLTSQLKRSGGCVERIYLEYCDAKDLFDIVVRQALEVKKPFDELKIWELFECLARAALVMHTGSDDIPAKIAPVGSTSKEWVHLDLKHENIFAQGPGTDQLPETGYKEHENSYIFKMGDLGHMTQAPLPEQQTRNWYLNHRERGTMEWLAPEQGSLRSLPGEHGARKPWLRSQGVDPNNPQRLVRTDWRQSRNEETLEAGLGNLSESLVLGTATNVWQIGLLIHETMKLRTAPRWLKDDWDTGRPALHVRFKSGRTLWDGEDKKWEIDDSASPWSKSLRTLVYGCLSIQQSDRPDPLTLVVTTRKAVRSLRKARDDKRKTRALSPDSDLLRSDARGPSGEASVGTRWPEPNLSHSQAAPRNDAPVPTVASRFATDSIANNRRFFANHSRAARTQIKNTRDRDLRGRGFQSSLYEAADRFKKGLGPVGAEDVGIDSESDAARTTIAQQRVAPTKLGRTADDITTATTRAVEAQRRGAQTVVHDQALEVDAGGLIERSVSKRSAGMDQEGHQNPIGTTVAGAVRKRPPPPERTKALLDRGNAMKAERERKAEERRLAELNKKRKGPGFDYRGVINYTDLALQGKLTTFSLDTIPSLPQANHPMGRKRVSRQALPSYKPLLSKPDQSAEKDTEPSLTIQLNDQLNSWDPGHRIRQGADTTDENLLQELRSMRLSNSAPTWQDVKKGSSNRRDDESLYSKQDNSTTTRGSRDFDPTPRCSTVSKERDKSAVSTLYQQLLANASTSLDATEILRTPPRPSAQPPLRNPFTSSRPTKPARVPRPPITETSPLSATRAPKSAKSRRNSVEEVARRSSLLEKSRPSGVRQRSRDPTPDPSRLSKRPRLEDHALEGPEELMLAPAHPGWPGIFLPPGGEPILGIDNLFMFPVDRTDYRNKWQQGLNPYPGQPLRPEGLSDNTYYESIFTVTVFGRPSPGEVKQELGMVRLIDLGPMSKVSQIKHLLACVGGGVGIGIRPENMVIYRESKDAKKKIWNNEERRGDLRGAVWGEVFDGRRES